jgi:hypothetical protein
MRRKYSTHISRQYRYWRNNMRYIIFAKPRLKKAPKEEAPKVKPIKITKETVKVSIGGKLAAIREITKHLESYAKPTKQTADIKAWLQQYEKELYQEWNRITHK